MTRAFWSLALCVALSLVALWAGAGPSAADTTLVPGGQARLSPVIYPPQRSPLAFSHADHEALVEDCTACHVRAKTSRSSIDRLIPGEAVCAGCHDIDRQKPGASCAACHPGFAVGKPVARVAMPVPNLKFSHQAHAGRGIACERCHPRVAGRDEAGRADLPAMALCLSCHDGRQARDDCALCHLAAGRQIVTHFPQGALVPQSGLFGAAHTALFATHHENAAATSEALCGSCHERSFCSDCHAGSIQAARFHPVGFVAQHGIAAWRNTPDCSACHRRQTFCVGCHARSGVVADGRASSAFPAPGERAGEGGRFHPPGWVAGDLTGGSHGVVARRNLASCVSCHREEHCTRCHSAQPGAPRANPHPPGWAHSRRCRALLSKNKRLCLRCHIDPAEVSCGWP